MKPTDLLLRCYAEQKDGYWQAFCLDLCLAAQGDSPDEVQHKLADMICEYVSDAIEGEDREFAAELLNRRAPLRFWMKYYVFWLLLSAGALQRKTRLLFTTPWPMVPSRYCHHH